MTKNLKVLLLIFGGVVLIALVVFGYFFFIKGEATVSTNPSPSTSVKATPSASTSSVLDAGVTWMEPKVLGDLDLIKKNSEMGSLEVSYYQIADLSGGGMLILAKVSFEGPGNPQLFRFKKDAQGKYFYLVKHSAEKNYNAFSKYLKNATPDSTTMYQSLSLPDFISVNGKDLKSSSSEGIFSDLKNPKEIGQIAYGKVYRTLANSTATEVGGIVFNVKLADFTYRQYTIKIDFLTDDEVAQITWSDNSKNTAKYTPEGYTGCAMVASDNAILNTAKVDSRLTEAGKTSKNEKVYTVSKDDVVMKAAYNNYLLGRTKDVLSIEEFANKKPVFVWKDGLGDYIVFTGRDFAGLAECGKPVIYLYPEKTTNFSLKVAATITQSEPAYSDGWSGIAYVGGKLKVAGKIYDSLYWEGKGQEYPMINEGVVVEKEKVAAVLRSQLSQLGLTAKESADFLEFWLPKMPEAPYVRLTWFGTQEMNRLAPLAVDPAPDTMIRVFLDFEGLNSKIDLSPQKLTSIERIGFTLVEWGGLLRK